MPDLHYFMRMCALHAQFVKSAQFGKPSF